MKYPRLLVLLPVLALFLCTVGGAQAGDAGISGTWRISQEKPSGVTLTTFLTLKQDGDKLTGSVLVNTVANLTIREPRMDGADAVFRVDWGWNFRVRPDGRNLHVVVTYDGGGREESTAVPADMSEEAIPAAAQRLGQNSAHGLE
jgi:hypothetical protein